MARRLSEPDSSIRKVYIVRVEPAVQPTARERELGLTSLPRPARDLSVLLKKGNRLLDAYTSLKPLVEAAWLDEEQSEQTFSGVANQLSRTMRLVMVEGRKRQIRHMCRQLLGWHVVGLRRVSIGPVLMDSLPEGKWRPLTQDETKSIFEAQPGFSTGLSKKSKSKRRKPRRAMTIET